MATVSLRNGSTQAAMKMVMILCICVLLLGCGIRLPEVTIEWPEEATTPSPIAEDIPLPSPTADQSSTTLLQEQTLLTDGALAIAETPSYQHLPEVVVSSEYNLVTSPAYQNAHLLDNPIPAGERVRVIGEDKNAAWLLVIYRNTLGWMPSFYSGTGIGRLGLTVVSDSLSEPCIEYLDAVLTPEEIWVSSTSGSTIVKGIIYRPQPEDLSEDDLLTLEIEEVGQEYKPAIEQMPLETSGEILLFTFILENLQPDNQLRFQLKSLSREPIAFQASFFRNNCSEYDVAESAESTEAARLPEQETPSPFSEATAPASTTTLQITLEYPEADVYISRAEAEQYFSWNPEGSLADNQSFEIRFYKLGETGFQAPFGWVKESGQQINLNNLNSGGDYQWSVVIVQGTDGNWEKDVYESPRRSMRWEG